MNNEDNKVHLNKLIKDIQYWMHLEDSDVIKVLTATKVGHKLSGDPVWLMLIGPSSDGKSELLRAFTEPLIDLTIDDLTENTFVSGWKGSAVDQETPHFAEEIRDKIWFIYDFSILLTKRAESRSNILSQMRMIYDGKLTKKFGNKITVNVNTYPNTLIVGSTPAIDSTILEDQLLGTRFMTFRMNNSKTDQQRLSIMEIIDRNEKDMGAMRDALNSLILQFFSNIDYTPYDTNEQENHNLATFANFTTILRTSVQLDKSKEPMNVADPEGPGRLYKQLKKLYRSLRMIGCDETDATRIIRKLCMHNITPVRCKILRYLNQTWSNRPDGYTTSEIAGACLMGKGSTKGNLHALTSLGLVEYEEIYDDQQRRMLDNWRCLGFENFNLLLGGQEHF